MNASDHATSLHVALDVSSLRDHGSPAADFVRFVWAACALDPELSVVTWTSSWAPLRSHGSDRAPSRPVLGSFSALLGARMSTRWVVPRADVVFLASGQGPLRASVPGVVSVLEVAGLAPSQGRSAARRRTLLGRAADDGVLVHAATQGLADVLVAEVGLHRSQVVVVHPGIEEVAAPPAPVAHNGVVVLEGTDGRRDQAICDTLRAAGTPAVLVSSSRPPLDAKCAVLASPGEGFPFGALRLLAAGVPLVAARTPTTTELLEGAAELVDPRATDDVVDSVLGFTRDDTSRSIAVAAGRTRASDFSWSRRAGDVTHLVRRAAQRR